MTRRPTFRAHLVRMQKPAARGGIRLAAQQRPRRHLDRSTSERSTAPTAAGAGAPSCSAPHPSPISPMPIMPLDATMPQCVATPDSRSAISAGCYSIPGWGARLHPAASKRDLGGQQPHPFRLPNRVLVPAPPSFSRRDRAAPSIRHGSSTVPLFPRYGFISLRTIAIRPGPQSAIPQASLTSFDPALCRLHDDRHPRYGGAQERAAMPRFCRPPAASIEPHQTPGAA